MKAHDIVHRDVKLDNVLLTDPGTEEEAAVLTDFGMCFDLKKYEVGDFQVHMPVDGWRRGGAPIALAPEVTLPKPGPEVYLDYSKNDEWAVGMIGHELLSSMGAVLFADMEHPKTYTDAGYQDESIPERCRPLIAALLSLPWRSGWMRWRSRRASGWKANCRKMGLWSSIGRCRLRRLWIKRSPS